MAEATRLAGNVPQLLFDDALIDRQHRLVRRWLPATIYPEPLIRPEHPWEGRMLAFYGTVLTAPDGAYRLYYSTFGPGRRPAVCLATSSDGFSWRKPTLGHVLFAGDSRNNLVMVPQHLDSPSLMKDPRDERFPYKMMAFAAPVRTTDWHESWGMYAYQSADGISWRMIGERPVLRAGDRSGLMAAKPDGKYVLYTRAPGGHRFWRECGGRHICRFESEDFQHWSEPELVLAPDLTDEPDIEFYGMMVFERHGWFIGLLEYWNGALDKIEVHLAVSRDGKQWRRPASQTPFIAATCPWNATWSSCGSNGPVVINETMVFFFGGRWTSHHYDSAQQLGVIGMASAKCDRFCALEATTGGEMTTTPLVWPGGELRLNADTSQSFHSHPCFGDGQIFVEVLDAQGRAIEGFGGDQRACFRGNTHCRGAVNPPEFVAWPAQKRLNSLRGRTIRLHFRLEHARLFTFAASDAE